MTLPCHLKISYFTFIEITALDLFRLRVILNHVSPLCIHSKENISKINQLRHSQNFSTPRAHLCLGVITSVFVYMVSVLGHCGHWQCCHCPQDFFSKPLPAICKFSCACVGNGIYIMTFTCQHQLYIYKKVHLCNLIYTFNEIPNKIPASYFLEITELVLKFIWKDKRPRTANTTLKKNKVRGLTLLNFKTYYKPIVIKTVQY